MKLLKNYTVQNNMETTFRYAIVVDGEPTGETIKITTSNELSGCTDEISSAKYNIAQEYIDSGCETVAFILIGTE